VLSAPGATDATTSLEKKESQNHRVNRCNHVSSKAKQSQTHQSSNNNTTLEVRISLQRLSHQLQPRDLKRKKVKTTGQAIITQPRSAGERSQVDMVVTVDADTLV
jgi:hypothetical protein